MRKNHRKKNGRGFNQRKSPAPPSSKLLEQINSNSQMEKSQPDKETRGSWFSNRLYAIYGIVWLYFVVKVFIVDVEAWVFELIGMERYRLFLSLRIFLIPCLITVFISWKGYKIVLRHIFHFLTVPFYFSIYLPLKSVYDNFVGRFSERKNVTFLVLSLEILGRIVARINYYLFSLLGVSVLLICLFYPNDKLIQYGAFFIGTVLVCGVMYQSVLKAVQPQKIFGFFKIDDIISFSTKKQSLLPKINDSKPKSQAETIRELLFSHILITLLQKNISEVRERKSFLILAFADFFLLILTISLYFTFLNYSLFLIAPANFGGQISPSFWDFAYYSFYAIPGESTSIEPVGQISKIIKVSTTYYGYYLFMFLGTMLLGVFSDKFTKALESASDFLQQQSTVSEPKLSAMLGIPIAELKMMSLAKLFKLGELMTDGKK